eukprot:360251-Chlamydomonas_euryale.AAC.2
MLSAAVHAAALHAGCRMPGRLLPHGGCLLRHAWVLAASHMVASCFAHGFWLLHTWLLAASHTGAGCGMHGRCPWHMHGRNGTRGR